MVGSEMSGAVQISPWARQRRQNALTASLRSIPMEEARAALALAICQAYGRKGATGMALNLPGDIMDAIEEGAADA